MSSHSQNTQVTSETQDKIVLNTPSILRAVGGCFSFMALLMLLFFLCIFLPSVFSQKSSSTDIGFDFILLAFPAICLLFIALGVYLTASYQLTLDWTTRTWQEQKRMLWWQRTLQGSLDDIQAVRYVPHGGEHSPTMVLLEWRDKGKTMITGGRTPLPALAEKLSAALNLSNMEELTEHLKGQRVWTGTDRDKQEIRKRDNASVRVQGGCIAFFGVIWLAFILFGVVNFVVDLGIDHQLDNRGQKAQGKILSSHTEMGEHGAYSWSEYQFTLPTKQVEEGKISETLSSGTPIEVEYLPENPEYHRVAGHHYKHYDGSPLFGVVFLLLFLGAGGGITYAGVKMIRAKPKTDP